MNARDLDCPDGQAALRRAVDERWLLAFDFDGTLAPLVDDPHAAAMPAALRADLTELARLRQVAVVTGRARADVLPRLPASLAQVVGNHGCERGDGDAAAIAAATAMTAGWLVRLDHLVRGTGLRIEAKGPSLTLHWRGSRDPLASALMAQDLALQLSPRPDLIHGDHVLNLIPPGLPDKGAAVLDLLAQCACAGALFVGDDLTDAAVFMLGDPRIVGIGVGNRPLGAQWRVADAGAVAVLVRKLVMLCGVGP
ncbi:MAG: trehalose-phosphatase [Planctomycetes bacterium]|nr:trehalose-phosphatase [Planctomycetota bacterium]